VRSNSGGSASDLVVIFSPKPAGAVVTWLACKGKFATSAASNPRVRVHELRYGTRISRTSRESLASRRTDHIRRDNGDPLA